MTEIGHSSWIWYEGFFGHPLTLFIDIPIKRSTFAQWQPDMETHDLGGRRLYRSIDVANWNLHKFTNSIVVAVILIAIT